MSELLSLEEGALDVFHKAVQHTVLRAVGDAVAHGAIGHAITAQSATHRVAAVAHPAHAIAW